MNKEHYDIVNSLIQKSIEFGRLTYPGNKNLYQSKLKLQGELAQISSKILDLLENKDNKNIDK